ncbi:MAG: hypothetical protein Q7U04_01140 [Bacteriovorax sp.]|nr:hypothetical protein [Bacteriovorax sp.]
MQFIPFKKIIIGATFLIAGSAFSDETHPIYRSYSGNDYLFSTNPTEGPKAGYFPDEARFRLFEANTPGTSPLYRCLIKAKGNSHFLSTEPTCEGQRLEGSLGNVSNTPGANLVGLVRYVNVKTNNHIMLIAGNEELNFKSWKREGIQGYVVAETLPKVTQTRDDGKKYFSFFAGAMDGVGNQDYIPELAKVSNLIFIKSKNFEQKLIECEQLGVKATVTFDWLFFDDGFHLKEDYAEAFKSVEPIIRRHLSTIAAFYGQDEPYTNGLNAKLSVAEIYNAQETMGRFLKSKFPDMPIGVILTTAELRDSRPLFPSFDWFGFDCYSASMKCEGYSVDWYYEHLNTMLTAMTNTDHKPRYLISVPQAGHPVRDRSGERDIMAQVPPYRQIVKRYSNVKMVMPFIWQTFNDGNSNWIGAREMPVVRSAYELFYSDFMAGTL